MRRALKQHALANTRFDQQINRTLLHHARAQCRLDVSAAPRLEHNRFDARKMQQV